MIMMLVRRSTALQRSRELTMHSLKLVSISSAMGIVTLCKQVETVEVSILTILSVSRFLYFPSSLKRRFASALYLFLRNRMAEANKFRMNAYIIHRSGIKNLLL